MPSTGARCSGYTAVLGRLEWAAAVLYAGAIAWTIGYDTIYAHQDRDDDALLGLEIDRAEIRPGDQALALRLLRVAWLGITIAGCSPALRSSSCLAWLPPAPISSGKWPRSISTIRRIACRRFRSNRDFGLIVFAAIVLDLVLASQILGLASKCIGPQSFTP